MSGHTWVLGGVLGAALAAGVIAAAPLDAQVREGARGDVQLRSAYIAAPSGRVLLPGAIPVDGQEGVFIVAARGPADQLRRGLEARGMHILRYLPDGAWLVRADGGAIHALVAEGNALGLSLIDRWHPRYKLAPEVGELIEEGGAGLVVHLFDGADVAAARAIAQAHGAQVTMGQGAFGPRLGLRAKPEALWAMAHAVAELPEVFWVEARGEVRLLNATAVPLLQSGSSRGPNVLHEAGLRGEGQLVAYIDTGLDHDSCWFRDDSGEAVTLNGPDVLTVKVNPNHRKVHAYDFLWSGDRDHGPLDFDNHGHGTHVGGNIGGHSIDASGAQWDGLAPMARFVVQDGGYAGTDNCADLPGLGCPVVELIPLFEQAYKQGARIHSNSWGDNENSSTQWTYSAGSEDVDAISHAHPDYLLIFAAGNSGPGAGTVGSPSTAKNAIAVGGSGNAVGAERVVSFSSRGPTDDGRIKPDVMAPASNTSAGTDRDVTTENCDTNSGSGTSYAAPLVAGAAALVRQYFVEGYYPSGEPDAAAAREPSAALMKAMLVAASVDMTRAGAAPSFDQGFGRVQLDRALRLGREARGLKVIDDEHRFDASADAPYTLTVDVASDSIPLEVSLVWTDPPSSPAAKVHLVNDLDLTLEQGGRTYRGNHLRGGRSIPGGEADRLNTVEVIRVEAPRVGRSEIVVSPHHIPLGPQGFALVVTGDLR